MNRPYCTQSIYDIVHELFDFLGADDLVYAEKSSSHRPKREFATEYAETIQNEKNELNAMI